MRFVSGLVAACLFAAPALAQCGGGFNAFVRGLKTEAAQQGFDAATVDAWLCAWLVPFCFDVLGT